MKRERESLLFFLSRVFNLYIRNVCVQQCDLYLDIPKSIELRTILFVNNRNLSLNVFSFFFLFLFFFSWFYFFKTLNLLFKSVYRERSSVSNLFRLNSSTFEDHSDAFLFVSLFFLLRF